MSTDHQVFGFDRIHSGGKHWHITCACAWVSPDRDTIAECVADHNAHLVQRGLPERVYA